MCLFVDNAIHGTRNRKPFVAPTPILVYKRLREVNSVRGVSPFLNTEYVFGVEKSISRFGYRTYCGTAEIEEGLHAFRKAQSGWYIGTHTCPAVIPVGAKVWISGDGEVATNRMTVYRDMDSLKKALKIKSIAPGIPVADVKNWKKA